MLCLFLTGVKVLKTLSKFQGGFIAKFARGQPTFKLAWSVASKITTKQSKQNGYCTGLLGHDAVVCKSTRKESLYNEPLV